MSVKDFMGVEIKVGDHVIVNAWGGRVRLSDTHRSFVVDGFTRAGNLTHHTSVANGLAVDPQFVGVLRRDGRAGLEGNRPFTTTDPEFLGRP